MVDSKLSVEELDETGKEVVELVVETREDVEELEEETREDGEVSMLVELSEFEVGSNDEEEDEELPAAVWLAVKDVLER